MDEHTGWTESEPSDGYTIGPDSPRSGASDEYRVVLRMFSKAAGSGQKRQRAEAEGRRPGESRCERVG